MVTICRNIKINIEKLAEYNKIWKVREMCKKFGCVRKK